jgi:hypothetical protein
MMPLGGLYSFHFDSETWQSELGLIHTGEELEQIGRMPTPNKKEWSQLPTPRYGAHLVPVMGQESSSSSSVISLMLIGGLDGERGVSSDEVSVYNIALDKWDVNVMTG